MNWDYLSDNKGLVIACLLVGFIFGAILPMILTLVRQVFESIGHGLYACFSNAYFVFMFFAFQLGLEIFLLQQWIFGYNIANGGGGAYDSLAYLPLTVTIPAFFANIVVFVGMCLRFGEILENEKNKK